MVVANRNHFLSTKNKPLTGLRSLAWEKITGKKKKMFKGSKPEKSGKGKKEFPRRFAFKLILRRGKITFRVNTYVRLKGVLKINLKWICVDFIVLGLVANNKITQNNQKIFIFSEKYQPKAKYFPTVTIWM